MSTKLVGETIHELHCVTLNLFGFYFLQDMFFSEGYNKNGYFHDIPQIPSLTLEEGIFKGRNPAFVQ